MKWRFLILTEEYDIFGTNSESLAKRACADYVVYDCMTGHYFPESINEHCLSEIKEFSE